MKGYKHIYSQRKRLSDGTRKTYYFHRHTGAFKPLAKDKGKPFYPDSPAWLNAYMATLESAECRAAGTFQSIINEYCKSPAFTEKANRTKVDYSAAIRKIEDKWGEYPIEVMNDPKIRPRLLAWRDSLGTSSLRQADAIFAVMRTIIEFGRNRGRLEHNHATRPGKLYHANRSDKLWSDDDVEALRSKASAQIVFALELGLLTGQRQGDLFKMTWGAYDGQRLRFRQGKSGRKVDMPVRGRLRDLLEVMKERRKGLTILETQSGRPWTKSHFNNHWRPALKAAGLDGLHFHDLRGTACTKLAEAGCSAAEIAAYLGWSHSSVARMLEIYQAMTASLCDSAVTKLELKK